MHLLYCLNPKSEVHKLNLGELRCQISLPTTQQWQRAATGDTGWKYPWGNELGLGRACFNTTNPVLVTDFPSGASPFGVFNMSGNVWEWCLNDYKNVDKSEISDAVERRTLKGGSWDFSEKYLTSTSSTGGMPSNRNFGFGFRCVLVNE